MSYIRTLREALLRLTELVLERVLLGLCSLYSVDALLKRGLSKAASGPRWKQ
jgi:hypothetical protein